MDNKLIMRSLRDRVNYRDLSSLTSNEDEAYAYLSSMKQSDIDNLDLGSDYSFYFFHDNEYIFCPMNIDMISGRASQMRSAYYGESHLLTVIGFLSEKCSDFPLPTMVKHLDIAQNLNSRLWSNVKRIIPLAIYTEIPF